MNQTMGVLSTIETVVGLNNMNKRRDESGFDVIKLRL